MQTTPATLDLNALAAATKTSLFFQNESERAYAAAAWEREHGGLSRVAMLQERAAGIADYTRKRVDIVTRQIALDTSYAMGRAAAQQGADYFTGCKLTDAECRGRWADGFNSTREMAW